MVYALEKNKRGAPQHWGAGLELSPLKTMLDQRPKGFKGQDVLKGSRRRVVWSTAGLRADTAAQAPAPGCHVSKQRHTTTAVVVVVFKGTFKDHVTFLNPRLPVPGPTGHARALP